MKLSEQLFEIRDSLEAAARLGLSWDEDDITIALLRLSNACAVAVEREALIHASHEFMSGEWQPDDVERARHTARLEAADNV